jgi:type I restriction enzyme S subunit
MDEIVASVVPRRFEVYPAYKNSGLEWLGKIPTGWGVKRLRFAAHIEAGQSPPSEHVTDGSEGLPFLQGNADFGQLNPAPRQVCDAAPKQARSGDILLSVRAPVGAINIADQPYGIGRGLCAIRPSADFSLRYFFYNVSATRSLLDSVATGSTYDAVTASQVGDLPTFVPPLPEQFSIAAFLDRETARIDALMGKNERLIRLLEEQRIALIARAVTNGLAPSGPMKDSGVEWLGRIPASWKVKRLKRIFHVVNGSTPASGEPSYWDGDIPWITPDDLGDLRGTSIYEARRNITELGYHSCGTTLVPLGSLVLSTRAPIGHLAIAGVPLCTNQGCRSLVFRGTDSATFFFYELMAARPELESLGQGSTFMELAKGMLEDVELVVPPETGQRAIAAFLDRETAWIDSLAGKVRGAIDRLGELRNALISAAVTGEIDVREEAA